MGWPIIEYGSNSLGTCKRSCIEAVKNRACRYLMAVGYCGSRGYGLDANISQNFEIIGEPVGQIRDMEDNRQNKRMLNGVENMEKIDAKLVL